MSFVAFVTLFIVYTINCTDFESVIVWTESLWNPIGLYGIPGKLVCDP